jgi:hypothetical protein
LQFKTERTENRKRAAEDAAKHRECELELVRLIERDKAKETELAAQRRTTDKLMEIALKGGTSA